MKRISYFNYTWCSSKPIIFHRNCINVIIHLKHDDNFSRKYFINKQNICVFRKQNVGKLSKQKCHDVVLRNFNTQPVGFMIPTISLTYEEHNVM